MNEPPDAAQSPGDDGFPFRRRIVDETADTHQEGHRLLDEVRAARKQWLDIHTRMASLQREIDQTRRPEAADTPASETQRLLQEERVAHDLTRLALERELTRARKLEDEVLSIQDRERARVARDLHDGISQNLVAVALLMEMHLRQLQEREPDSQAVRSGLKLNEILGQTIQELRGLSHGLSGIETGVRGENLCGALETMAGRLSTSGSVRCVVICPDPPAPGSANATHIYRIAQEAASNAVRHGKAERIEIGLARVGGHWRLTVKDDGVGMAENPAPDGGGGLGMRSMKYRAAVIGGTLTVRRARTMGDRPGTVVSCAFP